jgi:hypothetical protein|tara:strand:+ start:600 stop:1142 length:543 start_codon:yes stop_codon:yes gene_type:complete
MLKHCSMNNIKHLTIFLTFILILPMLGCENDDSEFLLRKGRTIAIGATPPIVRDRVTFTDTAGKLRLVKPISANNKLVIVKLKILNDSVTHVPVFIDTEAAELGDRGGSRGWNIDPYVNSVIIATEESELDKYTPFLNGHIELNKGFEVQGWMIFDIPRSIKPLTIWWRESDDIVIDLPK